jgi:hypothetical protein
MDNKSLECLHTLTWHVNKCALKMWLSIRVSRLEKLAVKCLVPNSAAEA